MSSIILTAGVDTINGNTDVGVQDIVSGRSNNFTAGDVLVGGADTTNDRIQIIVAAGTPTVIDLNAPAALLGWEELRGRNVTDDIFQISAARLDQFTLINGGSGANTDIIDVRGDAGVGVASLVGTELVRIEEIHLNNAAGTHLTLDSIDQLSLITQANGADDDIDVGEWEYTVSDLMSAFGVGIEVVRGYQGDTPATRADYVAEVGAVGFTITRTDTGTTDRYWDEIVDTYDNLGVLNDRTITNSDGTVYDDDFVAGVISQRTITDGGNNQAFTTKINTYDAVGQIVSSVENLDNGNTNTISYVNGVRDEVVLDDTNNNEAFDTRTFSYVGGTIALTRTVNDDGTQRVQAGSPGATLLGGAFDDGLYGAAGADVFEFVQNGGHDTGFIFDAALDLLDFTDFGIDELADFTGSGHTYSQEGSSILFEFSGGESFLLRNFTVTQLESGPDYFFG